MVLYRRRRRLLSLRGELAPHLHPRVAGVAGRVFGGRRKAKCLVEEVLRVRGIPKTNKRRMKYTGIAKCDLVAVAKCSGWLSAFRGGGLEGGGGMVKENLCEMCPGRAFPRQSWGVSDYCNSGFSGGRGRSGEDA